MKRILLITVAIVSVLGASLTYYLSNQSEDEHVHYHAGFRVYIDGTLQNYSDYKYMNFVPCSEHDKKKSNSEEQIEKAHLHDSIGDVVHVHRAGAVWGDLFKNIGVQLPSDKLAVMYLNGELASDMYNQPIKAYDTAIFVFGSDQGSHMGERVSIDHIKEVEVKSELCGSD